MKILVLCVGTRGDVQPYVALGQALQKHGHTVVIATHQPFQNLVEENNCAFANVGTDLADARLHTEEGQMLATASWYNALKRAKAFMEPLVVDWMRHGLCVCEAEQPQFAVLSTMGCWVFPGVLEKHGIPYCAMHLAPFTPTRAHAPPLGFGSGVTWFEQAALLKWNTSLKMGWSLLYRDTVNRFRSEIGLEPVLHPAGPAGVMAEARVPVIHAYSSALCKRSPDLPAYVHLVGHVSLPPAEDYSSTQLEAFFTEHRGSKPIVYVGYGSMLGLLFDERQNIALLRASIQAVNEAGCAGIVSLRGVSASHVELPPTVLAVDTVPHTWLFERCDVVVCHGGSGTVHAALGAGKPIVVVPFSMQESDQPFWGARVALAGVGPQPIPALKATAASLCRAICQALRPDMKERATAAAEVMKAEPGAIGAAALIDSQLLPQKAAASR